MGSSSGDSWPLGPIVWGKLLLDTLLGPAFTHSHIHLTATTSRWSQGSTAMIRAHSPLPLVHLQPLLPLLLPNLRCCCLASGGHAHGGGACEVEVEDGRGPRVGQVLAQALKGGGASGVGLGSETGEGEHGQAAVLELLQKRKRVGTSW